MCRLNALDLCAIQECLDGYRKLVEWIPPFDTVDEEMKEDRLRVIAHLIDKCEKALVGIKDEG